MQLLGRVRLPDFLHGQKHPQASQQGRVGHTLFFLRIWRPLSLIKNACSACACGLVSAAMAHTVTHAMLATNNRFATAKADSCCHDSGVTSIAKCRIEPFELGAGCVSGELPVDDHLQNVPCLRGAIPAVV